MFFFHYFIYFFSLFPLKIITTAAFLLPPLPISRVIIILNILHNIICDIMKLADYLIILPKKPQFTAKNPKKSIKNSNNTVFTKV